MKIVPRNLSFIQTLKFIPLKSNCFATAKWDTFIPINSRFSQKSWCAFLMFVVSGRRWKSLTGFTCRKAKALPVPASRWSRIYRKKGWLQINHRFISQGSTISDHSLFDKGGVMPNAMAAFLPVLRREPCI